MLSCLLCLTGELANNSPFNLPVARVSLLLSNIATASPKDRHPVLRLKGQKSGGMWLGNPVWTQPIMPVIIPLQDMIRRPWRN